MKLAMVFPGQGSQSVGMMNPYDGYPVVRDTFGEASAALGDDLWALVASGPDEALNQTVNTQPAMLAADIAVYRAWRSAGGAAPAVLAGHSLGEYAALVAAGALSRRHARSRFAAASASGRAAARTPRLPLAAASCSKAVASLEPMRRSDAAAALRMAAVRRGAHQAPP